MEEKIINGKYMKIKLNKYTSESGFLIVEDNGKGVPNVFNYAV